MANHVDTIAAQATPPGCGGVGVIRISGPLVSSITQEILGKNLTPRQASFCNFFSQDKKIIDQGLAIYFPAPHSFTGEEVLELQGHGGQIILDLLLQRVLELGARIARPGEFIERAFLHHKLDLVQAEAVADLINAATSQAAKNAMRSLQGEFSGQVNQLAKLLTDLRIKIEASIDLVEEQEVEEVALERFSQELDKIILQIKQLKNTAKQGVMMREGITVVITGAPNAGKSSLLNYLSGQETAIVTDIPGTTRDVLRVWIQLEGLPIHLLDTAGIHDQPDLIESEGIKRAWGEIKKADHVLLVVDAATHRNCTPKEEAINFLKELPQHSQLTVLYNKIDLTGEMAKLVKSDSIDYIYLSLRTGEGLNLLKQHLKKSAGFYAIEDGFSARRRHLDALMRAEQGLQNIYHDLLKTGRVELIAEELKQAQLALGEITGKVTVDDLLGKIFAEFCVGK